MKFLISYSINKMLTPSLHEIRLQIKGLIPGEKGIKEPVDGYPELLSLLEQMDSLESELSTAYQEGGLPAASRVIIRPMQPDCQICGRTIISPTP